ncbi:GNAT family N-acetyltransferase [Virgibacillus byunsanensis]|uniref:GNAT family N-acetyltransferase n=1 Tax=Virgibacillus byunsanensis TaxID=570945 RepID=A0ABW3LR76_9BACI
MTTIKKGKNKFFVGNDETNPTAEITFIPVGEAQIDIDHTYVSEELRGEGMAGKLVDQVVTYAREESKKITATCPYAKGKLEKTPEYQDVLAE